jgi:hypothetical protein
MSDRGACWPDAQHGGDIAQDPIAYDKDLLGWIPLRASSLRARMSRPRSLCAVWTCPASGGFLMAQISIDGSDTHFYTVEARTRTGYDTHTPGDAVVIHEVDTSSAMPARAIAQPEGGAGQTGSDSAAMWTPGSVFVDPLRPIAVAIGEENPNGFVVTIDTRRLPWPRLPAAHSAAEAGPIAFFWQAVAGATGYQVELTALATPAHATATYSISNPSLTVPLSPGTYRWRVRATSPQGPGGWTAAWSLMVGQFEMETKRARGAGGHGPVGAGSSIAVDSAGNTLALWSGTASAGTGRRLQTNLLFAFRPAGGAWQTGGQVNDPQSLGKHSDPNLAVDAQGNAYAIWQDDRGASADIYFSYRPVGGTWSMNNLVNQNEGVDLLARPALAVDPRGDAFAVWLDSNGAQHSIHASYRPAQGQWGPDQVVSAGEVGYGPPVVAMDARGNAFVAWSSWPDCAANGPDMASVYFAAHPAAAGGASAWSQPVKLNGLPGRSSARPELSLDVAGNLYLTWQMGAGGPAQSYAATCGQYCGLPVAGSGKWTDVISLGEATSAAPLERVRALPSRSAGLCVPWTRNDGGWGCLLLAPAGW